MMVDETVDRFGGLDILVNNAGIWKGSPDRGDERRRVERDDRRQPDRHVPHDPRRGAAHEGRPARAASSTSPAPRVSAARRCTPLRRDKGAVIASDQVAGRRTGAVRHPDQLRGAGLGRDRHDARPRWRARNGRRAEHDPAGPRRPAGGDRRRRVVPRLGPGQFRQRRGAQRQRRRRPLRVERGPSPFEEKGTVPF